jgi:hypothetical protein
MLNFIMLSATFFLVMLIILVLNVVMLTVVALLKITVIDFLIIFNSKIQFQDFQNQFNKSFLS